MPHRLNPDESAQMPVLSWSEYCQRYGVNETMLAAEIEQHRRHFRREYQRVYRQQRRQQKKRLSTEWSKLEFRKLKKFAKRYRVRSLNQFIKKCVLAYLEDEYVEHDTTMAEDLKQQIRAIGNNINQMVHALHYTRDYTNRDYYQQLKAQIDALQQTVDQHRRQPPKLREQLEKLFLQVPESLDDFERFLETMKAKYGGDDH